MALKKFTWANGTQESPIALSTDELNVLIEAKKSGKVDSIDVSGYYCTTSGSIRNYLY
jgi:hypothetical protein